MLPKMWKSPPCRNIEVNTVVTGLGKSAELPHWPVSRHGISPNSNTNSRALWIPSESGATCSESWYRKTRTFTAIRAIVMNGTERDGTSSLSGNIADRPGGSLPQGRRGNPEAARRG